MILGVTGHRPTSMPGVAKMDPLVLEDRLFAFARGIMEHQPWGRPSEVISGMAEGWDQAVAEACVWLGLPFCAAVPFEGQERYWSGRSQQRYRHLLGKAKRVEIISASYSKAAYLKRDEWIVDNCEALLALCGKRDGGSAYTVDYARRWCVPTINVWNRWVQLHQ